MKIIQNCKSCGFFRYINLKGAAICSYCSKKLQSPYEIPDWCHLEDVPNQTLATHNCNDNIVGESPNYYCGICGQWLR